MKLKAYIAESYKELTQKVTWPTWQELQNSAIIVMVASLIIALLIYLMDASFSQIMKLIYSFSNQQKMAEIKRKWYVVRAIGGKEKKVKEYIESEIASLNLQDYVSQVLFQLKKFTKSEMVKKLVKKETFPGYVFN
jgi:preprotein translocase subunit SecE